MTARKNTPAHTWARTITREVELAAGVMTGQLDTDNYAGALRMAREVQRELDRALESTVWAWREAGASWAQIADTLGVTRQAAHKRFGATVEAYTAELEGRHVGENAEAAVAAGRQLAQSSPQG